MRGLEGKRGKLENCFVSWVKYLILLQSLFPTFRMIYVAIIMHPLLQGEKSKYFERNTAGKHDDRRVK